MLVHWCVCMLVCVCVCVFMPESCNNSSNASYISPFWNRLMLLFVCIKRHVIPLTVWKKKNPLMERITVSLTFKPLYNKICPWRRITHIKTYNNGCCMWWLQTCGPRDVVGHRGSCWGHGQRTTSGGWSGLWCSVTRSTSRKSHTLAIPACR